MQFVSIVDRSYVPGLFALLQSIRENGGLGADCRFLVYLEEPLPAPVADRLRAVGPALEFLDRRELGDIRSPLPQVAGRRHEYAFKKLLAFRVPRPGPLCFIDVDMLCLGPLGPLGGFGHFSAAPDIGIGEATSILGRPMFNTGLFLYEPSERRFEAMIEHIGRHGSEFTAMGDQPAVNHYFYTHEPGSVHLLDPRWNTLKRVKHHQRVRFDLGRVRLLHYVGKNPWDWDWADRSEWPYFDLARLWWGYFERSGGPAVLGGRSGRPSAVRMGLALARDRAARWRRSAARRLRSRPGPPAVCRDGPRAIVADGDARGDGGRRT